MAMILTDQITEWREKHHELTPQPPGPGPYKAKTSKRDREAKL